MRAYFLKLTTAVTVIVAIAFFTFSAVASAQIEIQSWYTSKGAKVLYVYSDQLPMVDIRVTFDAGSARDGDVWGLASFTSSMLGSATSTMTEEEISAAFNNVGSQFSTNARKDRASLSLRSLTRAEILQESLNVFAEIIADPVFEETILKREKSRLKISLEQRQIRPGVVASEAMWRTLYGDHPYAHPVVGTLETVTKFTPKKLQQFYNKHYVANNAHIAIVGNVDLSQAKKIAEKLTKGLEKGEKPEPLPIPKPLKEAYEMHIEFDSTQTHYLLSQIGVARGGENYPALFVANHMLGGGGFSSLLMSEVRKERGLVYSIYSYFAPLKVNGPFVIGLSTQNATAEEADKVVREVLAGFMKDFSDEHFQLIKDNLIGGFPLRMDSNSKILGYIAMIGFYNLPLDYLEWFPQQIALLTKQDVLDAMQQTIQPDKMLRVKVGVEISQK